MAADKTFYLTTAIFYVNGAPHLGHAYEAIASDALARFKRLDGYDVMFLSGTDEYGEKNARTAAKEGIEPQAFVDRNAALFEEMTDYLDISNDDFLRTSQPRHHAAAQAIWQKLADAGDIFRGSYEGWYSVRDEAYFTEDELTKGEGGAFLAPSGAEVEWVEEDSYFFRLSHWADKLLAHYEANPDFIQPQSRRNEVVSFVRSGLRDLSVSRRRLKWGIPVPGDEEHVMYVWLDALTNYITGVGYPDTESALFRTLLAGGFSCHRQRHRAVSHGVLAGVLDGGRESTCPSACSAMAFSTSRAKKMSKSLGNVLAPRDMIARYGLDQMRYFLLREVPFGQDGSFSHESIVNRTNSDLANDLGNLAQRILSMINKNCGRDRARARAVERGGYRTFGCRIGGIAGGARSAGCRSGLSQCTGGDLDGGWRCQSLCRWPSAVDIAQDRSGSDGHGAVCGGGNRAAVGDSGATLCAGFSRGAVGFVGH